MPNTIWGLINHLYLDTVQWESTVGFLNTHSFLSDDIRLNALGCEAIKFPGIIHSIFPVIPPTLKVQLQEKLIVESSHSAVCSSLWQYANRELARANQLLGFESVLPILQPLPWWRPRLCRATKGSKAIVNLQQLPLGSRVMLKDESHVWQRNEIAPVTGRLKQCSALARMVLTHHMTSDAKQQGAGEGATEEHRPAVQQQTLPSESDAHGSDSRLVHHKFPLLFGATGCTQGVERDQ